MSAHRDRRRAGRAARSRPEHLATTEERLITARLNRLGAGLDPEGDAALLERIARLKGYPSGSDQISNPGEDQREAKARAMWDRLSE